MSKNEFQKNQTIPRTVYIRKLNGLGEKLILEPSTSISKLYHMVAALYEKQTKDPHAFDLVFKGQRIPQASNDTLESLQIPIDGIIHVVFTQEASLPANVQTREEGYSQHEGLPEEKAGQVARDNKKLRVIYNQEEYQVQVNNRTSVLDFKKQVAERLNLVYESLVISYLGLQMRDDSPIGEYNLPNGTLLSLNFNLKKGEKKKLETRMVSSVTFSDNSSSPQNPGQKLQLRPSKQNNIKVKFQNNFGQSSKSIDSVNSPSEQIEVDGSEAQKGMYRSEINTLGSQANSKAAQMFKNALHQKIVETESVVSGSFSEENSLADNDPESLMVTVRSEDETKQFVFECLKQHQIKDIRDQVAVLQRLDSVGLVQISLEEDLFQSIDLSKSGLVSLGEVMKKMGRNRTCFVYRILSQKEK